uniref:DEP domain-containing protein n=1 Tax=Panagrolaimus sp. ES5 TaxID=591445 RepID=A0AC34GNS0_9BILA
MPSFKRDGGDLSVAEIVAVVEEQEESRISGSSNILLSSKTSNTQFHATKRWNKLITKFYETMPKRKHGGLILSYNNTFTGKAAVQFLVSTLFPQVCPNKPVDETNGIKFMEVLLKKKLIENVKFPESQLFISKAIYRFLTVNIAAEISATNLKRSNSITNFQSASNFASSFRPKAAIALDRRISSSCSNLQNLMKAELKIEATTTKTPFKFSSMFKPTEENSEEQENFGKNKLENDYFLKQVTCDRNPHRNNDIFLTPTISSSASPCTTIPSSTFSISSSSKSVKRSGAFQSSNIPLKRFNQGPTTNYDRANECETASKAEEYLSLLDSLIADEMLSESQKQRKLKGFRETYPQIYLLRFPEAAFTPKPRPRQPTPIRVFQKLIRRNSAKRKE